MASSSNLISEDFNCDVCHKPLANLRAYLKHVRVHTPKELQRVWSRCVICEQFYPTDFDRQSHGLKDHSDVLKTIKCSYCPMESLSNKEYFAHARSLHFEFVSQSWYKCSLCDEFRPSKISLNVHFKSYHKDQVFQTEQTRQDVIILERNLTQIKCKFCPLLFSNKAEYEDHLESHKTIRTSDSAASLVITSVTSGASQSHYECEFCIHEQNFGSKKDYLEHCHGLHEGYISRSWTQCNQCSLKVPNAWLAAHDCAGIKANQCSICLKQCETQDSFFKHLDLDHPDHGLFSHACDLCNISRPDKTTLMMHKLSHLSQNSDGPKLSFVSKKPQNLDPAIQVINVVNNREKSMEKSIKILEKTVEKPVSNEEIHEYLCGICTQKIKGTLHTHFQHAKACLTQKRSTISCMYCPQDNFNSMNQFSLHCKAIHRIGNCSELLRCLFCGEICQSIESLRRHTFQCLSSPEKASILLESRWTLCGFCPSIFFFNDLTKSPFFIAHMNTYHKQNVEYIWQNSCLRCSSLFPTCEALDFHASNLGCKSHLLPKVELKQQSVQALLERSSNALQNPIPNRIIIAPSQSSQLLNIQVSKPTPPPVKEKIGLIVSNDPLTFMNCGICFKPISGKKIISVSN